MFSDKHSKISFYGTLKSRNDELEYFAHERQEFRKFLCGMILLLGTIFFMISIFDYGYYSDKTLFMSSFKIRLCVFVVSILCALLVAYNKERLIYYIALTSYPIVVVFSYLLILSVHKEQGFPYQGMAILLILLCTTVFPLLWLNLLALNLTIVVFFILFSSTYIYSVNRYGYSEIIIYLAIAVVITSIIQRRNNITRRKSFYMEKQLSLQSTTDALTGCFNRLWFNNKLKEFSQSSQNEQSRRFSLILFDIDDFKRVNDTFGHLAGDEVLVECSALVKSSIRPSDYFARWGGEEFVLLLPLTNLDAALEIAERTRSSIESRLFAQISNITCSFGVVENQPGESSESLMQRVDKALYKAKGEGKNCVSAG